VPGRGCSSPVRNRLNWGGDLARSRGNPAVCVASSGGRQAVSAGRPRASSGSRQFGADHPTMEFAAGARERSRTRYTISPRRDCSAKPLQNRRHVLYIGRAISAFGNGLHDAVGPRPSPRRLVVQTASAYTECGPRRAGNSRGSLRIRWCRQAMHAGMPRGNVAGRDKDLAGPQCTSGRVQLSGRGSLRNQIGPRLRQVSFISRHRVG